MNAHIFLFSGCQYYLLYWLAGTAAAYFICPAGAGGKKRFAGLTLAVIATAIPFFGPVLSVAYAAALRSNWHRVMEPDLEEIKLPEHARDSRLIPSSLAAGSATARLRGSRDPRQKMEVLSRITDSRIADQHQILRSALSDSAEEVRLLAYAALDRREEENAGLVMKLERQMRSAVSPVLQDRLKQYRRWLDWNIAHAVSKDLAEPEPGHAVASTQIGATTERDTPADAGQETVPVNLLDGLQSLEQGDAQSAISHLTLALDAGVAGPVVAPPLAAAYFLERKYDKIVEVYQKYPELAFSPHYSGSFGLWMGMRI